MGLYVTPPFALFSLVNVPVQTLNDLLTSAKDGSTVEEWWLYLASSTSYDPAPHKPAEGGGTEGTEAPIDEGFSSPLVGKSVEDCAKWLQDKPQGIELDSNFFALLDKTAIDSKVVLCRIGDKKLKGDEVQCVLVGAEESTLLLGGMEYGGWESLVQGRGAYTPKV